MAAYVGASTAPAKGFTTLPEGGLLSLRQKGSRRHPREASSSEREARLLANLLVEGCKVAGERRERLERERR
jgi:hypothetical protein